MENSTFPTLSRQLFPKTVLTFIAILGLLMWSGLWFEHDKQQLSYQVSTELPKHKLALKNLEFRSLLMEQVSMINSTHQGGNLKQQHQHLVATAQNWQALYKPMRPVLDTLNSFDDSVLTRIDLSARDNEDIRQQALALVSATQTQLLATRQGILPAEVTESHDVLLQYVNALLFDISIGLKELSLQTTELRFEQLSSDIRHLLSAYEILAKLKTLTVLHVQIASLEQMFVSEQRLMGKWRGSIRLFKQYDDFISNQLTTVLNTELQLPYKSLPTSDTQGQHSKALELINIKLNAEQISMLLVGLFIGNFLWLMYLILSFRRDAQQYQELLNTCVDSAIDGKLTGEVINISADINQITQKIVKISQPKHSEADYQALVKHIEQQQKVMAKLGKIVSWSLSPIKGLVIDNAALIEVTLSPDINQHSLRHALSKEQRMQFIQALRTAKQNNTVEVVNLTLLSGTSLEVSLLYVDQQWQGTVAQHGRVLELEQVIAKEQIEHQFLAQKHHQHNQKAFEKIAEMLVQAMLQSQNMALVSGVSIQASYRPLARMFEWIRQQQIISEMAHDTEPKKQQDAILADEIFSAVFNAQSEAKLQQNTLFLNCDENLATHVRLDVRLFGRLISAFCQLALKEQFKSQIQLIVEAIDQNSGQQIVKFMAKVNTNKPLNQLPEHARWLLSLTDLTEDLGIETYFHTLLKRLNGEHVIAELTDSGYTFSFDLPISISAQSKTPMMGNKSIHTLVLSSDKEKQKVIKHYLQRSNYQVEGLAKVSLFPEQFDLATLKRRKLDLVVFVQHHFDELSGVMQHINSLPDDRKPKLVVLQQSSVGVLNKTGLFSLGTNPVSRESLLATCADILCSKECNNQLLAADKFEQFHFLASQVELLLAVHHPHQHQPLLMLLQWLGFNIRIVCHGKAMQKHWQSGRYLVLINEFVHSPFVELATGKLIARGVFHLNDKASANGQHELTLTDEQQELSKYWHVEHLPSAQQVKSVVKLLSPWLKVNVEQSRAAKRQRDESIKTVNENKRQNALFDSSSLDQLPEAFELEQFAQHQGSPELAAFMLDTYIENIEVSVEHIEAALFDANYHLLAELYDDLSLTAAILSAQGLMEIMLQLKQANQNKAFDKMERLLEQVKVELNAITIYANAI